MELFSKELSDTDIKKRLAVPTEVLRYFGLPQVGGAHSAELRVKDSSGRAWRFCCNTRAKGNYSKPVLQGGWLEFVRTNDLRVGDLVSFYQEYDYGTGTEYRIQVQRWMRIFGNEVSHIVA